MPKSFGRRCYDAYSQLPDGIRCHTDKAIRAGAKATKRLRDKKAIERQGESLKRSLRRRVGR